MAIDFPSNPSNGQQISAGGNAWQYNSAKSVWEKILTSGKIGGVITTYTNTSDLPLSGVAAGTQAFVTSSNALYISNGSGWYSIALVNTNPNITSVQDANANTTPFTLATDGTSTVITVTANDPEGFSLTYSYAVTSGSLTNGGGTTATVTQADNVFTITPTTNNAYAGTFSLTFTVSDGVNTSTSISSFTLEFYILNSRYTTLLATATGTSDNNNITDSSSSNHTITVTGDAYAGTFSPYRHGGYSTYFDGSGDYLAIADNADFDMGTGNFTIEFHMYADTQSLNFPSIISSSDYNSTGSSAIRFDNHTAANKLFMYTHGVSQPIIASSTTLDLNTWHHVALVRNGTSLKFFVDGSENGSVTISSSQTFDFSVGEFRVGRGFDVDTTNAYFNGHISDLRIVKGTALYTSAFTPPTERFTAIANTSLLTCHLPYIADGSTNGHTITINGNTSTKPFGPYDNSEYSAADHGGSVAMPNDNDYLYVSHSSTLKPSGTDPFCVSFWYYPTTSPGTDRQLVGDFQVVSYPSNCPGWDILYQTSGAINARWGYPNYADTGSGITNNIPIINAWNHIVFCRSGGNLSLFLNGKRCNTFTSNISISASGLANFYVGYAGEASGTAVNTAMGTIADFKYEVGTSQFDATASTITVPTAPQSTTNSVLHVKGTDASVIDKAQTGNMKVFGTATGSSAEAKFANTKSMYFPGSNPNHIRHYSQIYLPGELTIECWVNTSTFNSGYVWCLENYQLEMRINSNGTGVDIYDSGYINFTRAAGAMSTGTWYHIAVCRDSSNVFRAWIDGVRSTQSGTKTTTYDKDHIIIGGEYSSATGINWPYHGYVQDLRISNYARYSAEDETTNIPTEPLKG